MEETGMETTIQVAVAMTKFNRKEQDIIDAISGGSKLGFYHGRWVLYAERKAAGKKFAKHECDYPNHKACDKLVSDGVVVRNGTFIDRYNNNYERYVLAEPVGTGS